MGRGEQGAWVGEASKELAGECRQAAFLNPPGSDQSNDHQQVAVRGKQLCCRHRARLINLPSCYAGRISW